MPQQNSPVTVDGMEPNCSCALFIVIKNVARLQDVLRDIQAEPDFLWRKNDEFALLGKTYHRPDTVWGIKSLHVGSPSLQKDVDSIIKRMAPHEKKMQRFLGNDEFEVYLRIMLDFEADIDGLMISSSSLPKLQNICDDVIFFRK